MPTAYSLIPQERPATQEELVELYAPVVNWWVAKSYLNPLWTRDDIQQDAYLGLLYAWRTWRPDKGVTFKIWAVMMVRQWTMNKGLVYFGLPLLRAYQQDNLQERMAVINPLSLERMVEDYDNSDPAALIDYNAKAEFDKLFKPSFEDLMELVKNKRNRLILRRVYLDGQTYEVIGRELGISRQRVGQLLKKVYEEIKKSLVNVTG